MKAEKGSRSEKNKRVNKGTVALSLGSGGARGYTHIGVIDALHAAGYEVVAVSGCSMGAIVGGFYCADKLEPFRQWACSLTYMDVLKLVDMNFISSGAIRGNKVFQQLRQLLNDDDLKIEQLKKPFTAVATDLVNSKEVWFQTGSLEQAMRASSAIPGVIRPVKYQNKLFVDGGVLNPLPIAPCVSAHADHIIAIDLNTEAPMPAPRLWQASEKAKHKSAALNKKTTDAEASAEEADWFAGFKDNASRWFEEKGFADRDKTADKNAQVKKSNQAGDDNQGVFATLYKMFDTMQAQISQYKTAGYPPDLLIRVPYDCCEIYEFYRAQEMIELGRYIGEQAISAYEQGQSSLYARQISRLSSPFNNDKSL